MHIVVLALIVLINIILQSTIIQHLSINQISFNLFVITISSFSLLRGQRDGMLMGFFIGLLQDLFFGQLLGVYALIYMLLGYVVGFFSKIFYKESFFIPLVAITAGDLGINILVFISTLMFRGRINFPYYLFQIILPEMTYTALVSIFIYRIYLGTHNFLEKYDRWRGTRDKL